MGKTVGYFDGVTDAAFKKDSQGRNLFFPWGIFGSGFIVESEEQRNQIRNFFKKMYMVIVPTIIIIQMAVGFWLNLVLIPVYCVWYYFTIKKITQNLPRTTERLKTSEAYKNSAKSHNLPTLIFLELTSLGFVATGVWLLTIGKGSFNAYARMGFFGLGAVIFGYMIVEKIKNK